MKAVVVYDSKFGNTERVARAIAEELGTGTPAIVVTAGALLVVMAADWLHATNGWQGIQPTSSPCSFRGISPSRLSLL